MAAIGHPLCSAYGRTVSTQRRLDDVASRAGVSKGLFYLYFRSKDDLLNALQDQFSTELADFITVANGKVVSFVEFLDTALAARVLSAR